jgi:hypothetical protein
MPELLARRQDNAAGPGRIEASVVVPPHQVAASRSAGMVQIDAHDLQVVVLQDVATLIDVPGE